REIKASSFVEYGSMVIILVGHCNSRDQLDRATAVQWVHEFINLGAERLVLFYSELLGAIIHCISDQDPEVKNRAQNANRDLLELVRTTGKEFELSPLLKTLTKELNSNDVPTRMASFCFV
ncbi:unnamed protein product, partial [Discosporangium mesarthrocarpum]